MTKGSSRQFSVIQRFKIFSDAGAVAFKRGFPNIGLRYQGFALLTADSVEALCNLTDVNRLNDQVKSVRKLVQFDASNDRVVTWSYANAGTDKGLKIWKLYESGGSFITREVTLTRQAFLGAALMWNFSRRDPLALRKLPTFVVRKNGEVQLMSIGAWTPADFKKTTAELSNYGIRM